MALAVAFMILCHSSHGGRLVPTSRTLSHGLKLGDKGHNDLREKNVVLDKKEAFDFFGVFKGDIIHECYKEGCVFNEVVEHYGYSEKSYEYWNTYQCKKFNKDCDEVSCRGNPLGMEDKKKISGGGIVASSWYSPHTEFLPSQGRLNNHKGSWCPKSADDDPEPYLQVELPSRHNICAVATQGSALNEKYYVTEYKLQTSLDRENWVTYQENGTEKIFQGNSNARDMVKKNLAEPVEALFVRFAPKEWNNLPCMRVEVYGEPTNCTVKTKDDECCVFPFTYGGERIFTCASYSFGRKWCALTSDYDKDRKWGQCREDD